VPTTVGNWRVVSSFEITYITNFDAEKRWAKPIRSNTRYIPAFNFAGCEDFPPPPASRPKAECLAAAFSGLPHRESISPACPSSPSRFPLPRADRVFLVMINCQSSEYFARLNSNPLFMSGSVRGGSHPRASGSQPPQSDTFHRTDMAASFCLH